jgi:hypothetical protein
MRKLLPVLAVVAALGLILLSLFGVIEVSDSLPAIYGLTGTLVGAGMTVWSLERQVARDGEKEEEDSLRRARIAARILQADLSQAASRFKKAMEGDKYWRVEYGMPIEAWAKHRKRLLGEFP